MNDFDVFAAIDELWELRDSGVRQPPSLRAVTPEGAAQLGKSGSAAPKESAEPSIGLSAYDSGHSILEPPKGGGLTGSAPGTDWMLWAIAGVDVLLWYMLIAFVVKMWRFLWPR